METKNRKWEVNFQETENSEWKRFVFDDKEAAQKEANWTSRRCFNVNWRAAVSGSDTSCFWVVRNGVKKN